MESKTFLDSEPVSLSQAVGYFEGSLQTAIREVHVDISALKRDVEVRIEDMVKLLNPLSQTLTELQQENQELRSQVRYLTQQVEHLTAASTDPRATEGLKGPHLPPTAAEASDHSATYTTSTRIHSNEESREQNGTDPDTLTKDNMEMNKVQPTRVKEPRAGTGHTAPSQEHQPAAVGLAHQPITAVTKSGEKFAAEVSTMTTSRSDTVSNQSAASRHQSDTVRQTVRQSEWNVSTRKTITSSGFSGVSDTHSPSSVLDLYPDSGTKPRSPPPTLPRQGEKRPLLMRSQTLPRTSGPQARKALFEKFEQGGTKGKVGVSKVKLQRSQSFGVANASSIKQILLEWCRSKTIGYKLIDIQNFSSSWSSGLAFCALVHSFFPDAFDYNELSPNNRKQNFELAFGAAEKLAHCDRLIEVEDMMLMGNKPDPMCVFTYVQSLYNHLRPFE
ncbi:smoothelin, like [Stegostoma tigrinum]|uniref:smoothelin, like n=1 Tax=Stegostoma tigrinum TaxID=3053191 RepID=UPI00286FCF2A|nr:smoothelin, like [Stegostoma tigrinum]